VAHEASLVGSAAWDQSVIVQLLALLVALAVPAAHAAQTRLEDDVPGVSS
jgi:hypothetical protein